MSENNSLQVFDFENTQVRIVAIKGEPWFVAKDVCEVLGITWGGDRVSHVPDEWKGVRSVRTPGGLQEMLCLSEQGLYFFLARSDKPAALPFQKKVAGEIIPSIRKHGVYMTNEAMYRFITEPDQLMTIMQNWKADREKRIALETTVEENKPKVLFADSVSASDGTILVGELAKILKGNGIEVGQNRLFKELRRLGYLIKRKGSDFNMPSQRAMELGLFRIKETAVTHSDGHVTINKTPKITGKGQVYFVNMFLEGKVA